MCENEELFYGSVTVGERGQIVIPAEARAALGITAGDKILVMKHPANKGLMLFKFDAVREFVDHMTKKLEQATEHVEEAER